MLHNNKLHLNGDYMKMKISLLKGFAITALLFSCSNSLVIGGDEQTLQKEVQQEALSGKEAQAAVINDSIIKYFSSVVGKLSCDILSSIKDRDAKKSIKSAFDTNRQVYIDNLKSIIRDSVNVNENELTKLINKTDKMEGELNKVKGVESAGKFYLSMEHYYADIIAKTIAINDDNVNILKNIYNSLESVVSCIKTKYSIDTKNAYDLEARYNAALDAKLNEALFELIFGISKRFKDKGHITYTVFSGTKYSDLVRFKNLDDKLSDVKKETKKFIASLVDSAKISGYEALKQFEKNITVDCGDIKACDSIIKITPVSFNLDIAKNKHNELIQQKSDLEQSIASYKAHKKNYIKETKGKLSSFTAKTEKFDEKKHLEFVANGGEVYRLTKDGLFISQGKAKKDEFFSKTGNTVASINDLKSDKNPKFVADKLIKGWAEKVADDGCELVYVYTAKGTKIYSLSDLTANPVPKKLDLVPQFFTLKKSDDSGVNYTFWKKTKRGYESQGSSSSFGELIGTNSQQLEVQTYENASEATTIETPASPVQEAQTIETPASTAQEATPPTQEVSTIETPAPPVPPALDLPPPPPPLPELREGKQAGKETQGRSFLDDINSGKFSLKGIESASAKKTAPKPANDDLSSMMADVMSKRRQDVAHSSDDDDANSDEWSD